MNAYIYVVAIQEKCFSVFFFCIFWYSHFALDDDYYMRNYGCNNNIERISRLRSYM